MQIQSITQITGKRLQDVSYRTKVPVSSYGSDVLSEAPISNNTNNDMLNQSVQEMPYSEPYNFDTNSFAQQDALILSVFEQLSNQVTNCNKVNNDNLIANESLSAELERYKERVNLLEERQNVDLGTQEKLIIDDIIREKNTQFADFEKEINNLKQTLSKQSKEKELLTKTFNVFKNESKEKEAKNVDTEIALEKKVKELDNIVCKMGQSAQTVHILTKPQVFYDNNLKQALGFQNPFYLKKAQQIRPMLYDGNVIAKKTNVISIADSEETFMLEEESRSKMLLKQSDPMVLEKKVNTKPIDYAELNRLSEDFEGEWEFEHTKAVFQNEIIPFLKTLKDIFNVFDKDLLNEVTKVQTVFNQMEVVVQQYHVDTQCFKIQKKQFLIENDRLLDQIISQDIINIVVNSSVDVNTFVKVNSSVVMNDSVNYVEMCNKCLELKAELIKQHNMVGKDEYNRLLKRFSELEQHCISLEIAMQLNKEIFQKHNTYILIHKPSEKLVAVTPINKKKIVRFADIVTSSGNIPKVTNRPILSSTGVNPSTSASGSKPSGNTKNDRISQTPSSNEKNKVEVQSRKVKSSLNKRNSDSKNVCNEHVKHPVKGAKALCSVCNECLFDANHAMCLIDHVNSMNVRAKSASKKNKKRKEWKPTGKVFNSVGYKWKPTGRTFTLVGNACPLTRLTATNKVPLRVPIPLEVVAPKHVVTRVYTRRPKVPKSVQNSKPKVAKSMTANRMEPGTSRGSDTSVAPSSSSLIDCRLSKLFCVEDSCNEEPCSDVHRVGDEIEVEVLRNFNWPLSELITEDGVLPERDSTIADHAVQIEWDRWSSDSRTCYVMYRWKRGLL
ncbi:hypothetical protein Tco_0329324 [Tanacetum coccineum]